MKLVNRLRFCFWPIRYVEPNTDAMFSALTSYQLMALFSIQ